MASAEHLRRARVIPVLLYLVQDGVFDALVEGHLLVQVLLPYGLCKDTLVQVVVTVEQPGNGKGKLCDRASSKRAAYYKG
eukprot:1150573-Pelagomonas_calceolata.AAC.2